jgi:hypothetical protein
MNGNSRRKASFLDALCHFILLPLSRPAPRVAATMIAVDTLLKEALELPVEMRTRLVGELLRSLPPRPLAPAGDAVPTPPAEQVPITWQGAQSFLDD